MMKKEQVIRDKINSLFEYRKIPWLLEKSTLGNPGLFSLQLIQLQMAIYGLDRQLESVWSLDITDLKPYWLEIYSQLEELGLSSHQRRTWTSEIERYQGRELDLREGKSPLKYSMEDLYSFKSCDVRLMRRLIYQADPTLNNMLKFSEWTEFDLLTEVNDDIEDIYEDLNIINGNRFLFSLYELGKEQTRQRYEEFIMQKLDVALYRLDRSSSEMTYLMKDWINCISDQTLILLRDKLDRIHPQEIAESMLVENYIRAKSMSASHRLQ